jgi:hypothetical protein
LPPAAQHPGPQKLGSNLFSGRSSSPAPSGHSKISSDTFSLRGKKDKKEKKDKEKHAGGTEDHGKKKGGLFKMRWD